MTSKDSLENISGSAATAALIAAIPIFIILITYGWHEILKGILPTSTINWLPWLVAVFVSIIGIMLARAVAAERLRLSLIQNSKSKYSWIAPFLVLFMISALGSINTFFMLFQGNQVVHDGFSETNANLKALEQAINEQLKTPNYDKGLDQDVKTKSEARQSYIDFKNAAARDIENSKGSFSQNKQAAEAAWTQFQEEMRNPLQMGFGLEARKRFSELKGYLPELVPISGLEKLNKKSNSDQINTALDALSKNVQKQMMKVFDDANVKCKFSDDTVKQYSVVRTKVTTLPNISNAQTSCAKAEEVLESIESVADKAIDHMGAAIDPTEKSRVDLKEKARDEISKKILENDTFLAANPNAPVEESKKLLESSWSLYQRLYTELVHLARPGAKMNIPNKITIEELRGLGQIGNVLAILITRLSNPMTYFIFFGALLFDVILIAIYKRYLEVRVDETDKKSPFDGPDSNGSAPNIMVRNK